MAPQSFVDGRAQRPDSRQCLIIEAKTHVVRCKRARRWGRGVHGLLAAALIAMAVFVPRFMLTFALLIACVILSLVAFVFVVQLPVRYLASRLRDPQLRNARPVTQYLRDSGRSRRD